jgi:hypothetical protein
MVKVEADGSVDIPYKEIKEIFSDIFKHITSEKSATCMVLDISLQTIRDWYASFVTIFDNDIMKKIHSNKLPRDELDRRLKEISGYIYGRKYPDIIEESVRCLERLQQPDGPSRNLNYFERYVLRKFYIDRETLSTIKKLQKTENEFLTLATNMKMDFEKHYILRDKRKSLDPLDVYTVKKLLLERRSIIFKLISDIKEKIGCITQNIRILYEGLKL